MSNLMSELKTIHGKIEELEISEETASILYQAYIRSSKNWESRSLNRVEHEVNYCDRNRSFDRSNALMDYMRGSSFSFPLDTIISIKAELADNLRRSVFTGGFESYAKMTIINTLVNAQTRHLRYQVK